MIEIKHTSEQDLPAVKLLFREYESMLGIDLCFQGFEEELCYLPGDYAPPKGVLLLAEKEKEPVGCVAMRPLAADVCEMKRLFVRESNRGNGIGRQLVSAIVAAACQAGYSFMRLDTLPSMEAARYLYRSFGFSQIDPYYDSPIEGTKFLELNLNQVEVETNKVRLCEERTTI